MKECRKYFLIILLFFFVINIKGQKTVAFKIQNLPENSKDLIGIRGNTAPLSWFKTIFLKYDHTDSSYSGIVEFADSVNEIEYKYVIDNSEEIIWETVDNRVETINDRSLLFLSDWNVEKIIDPKTLPLFTVDQLLEDFNVIKSAILKIHPGLYRYNDSTTIKKNLDKLEEYFNTPRSYSEVILETSKFISSIQCDHTSVSAWNQKYIVNSIIHKQKDKVPFTFQWINGKMIITRNASNSQYLIRGTEIVAINGEKSSNILKTILPYINTDGFNDNNKISKAEVDGYIFRYSAFDMLYTLLYPLKEASINLLVKMPNQNSEVEIEVTPLTRKERTQILIERYPDFPKGAEDLWSYKIVDENIGYLKIGSFGTGMFAMDWKVFLKNAFDKFDSSGVGNLILDIRENQGGLDDASFELRKYIIQNNCVSGGYNAKTRFLIFPEEIKPHISTWDYWFYNLKVDNPIKEGDYYSFSNAFTTKPLTPGKTTFEGKIYLLVGSKNVSGAFYLARLMRKCKSALLVGQETGGNLNGINGGTILFLKPPNSQININLPIMGAFSPKPMPNRGIIPDISIKKSVEDVINNIDTELNFVLEIINNKSE